MHFRAPALKSLRAFEAAARHLSFRKAAEELHVTPAAISHQLRAIEENLGVQLFRRVGRGLQLTPVAEACLPRLRDGFDALAEAVELMRTRIDTATLRVGASPSLAAKWLIPRIGRFIANQPDFDIRVSASDEFVDGLEDPGRSGPDRSGLRKDEADVAIRFGTGKYPGSQVRKLFSVSATPMCSPRFLQGEHPLRRPEDLRHHKLVHDNSIHLKGGGVSWKMWLEAAGVDRIDVTRGPHFNHAALALDAAAEGMGVVLSFPVLAAADLAAGRLCAPFTLGIPLEFAYYIVSAETNSQLPKVAEFQTWLLEEARRTLIEELGEP